MDVPISARVWVGSIPLQPSPTCLGPRRQARSQGIYAAQTMAGVEESLGAGMAFELFTHVTFFAGHRVILLGRYNGQGLESENEADLVSFARAEPPHGKVGCWGSWGWQGLLAARPCCCRCSEHGGLHNSRQACMCTCPPMHQSSGPFRDRHAGPVRNVCPAAAAAGPSAGRSAHRRNRRGGLEAGRVCAAARAVGVPGPAWTLEAPAVLRAKPAHHAPAPQAWRRRWST